MGNALAGTVALVTGASSGIGEATARQLARQGASVALVARRETRLEGLARTIESEGGTALVVVSDITTRAAADDAVHRAVTEYGRLDTVVNSAGAMLVGPFADAPDGEWERMVDINLMGVLYLTKAALPHLVKAAEDSPRRD